MCQRDANDFFRFSCRGEALMESSKIGIVTPHHCGDHVKDGADVAPSATHHTFALMQPEGSRVPPAA